MDTGQWFNVLVEEIKNTSVLEYLGVGFGVAQVLLAKANKVWLYPTGIISVLISIYIFFGAKLYAEAALNLYYFIMSVYGWWLWAYKRGTIPLQITKTGKKDWRVTIAIVIIGFFLLWAILSHFTDSDVPVFDAWVSATAWAGMWLLAKRKLENWVLLNISNAVAIPLLLHKNLPLYTLLTIFLFIFAIQGYLNWEKLIKTHNTNAV
ncbi:MAG: hypothetical protein BGN92_01470 [Sphingobacteriales bacterium 41-5]|nr:MAG: hypothetical protein ABS67_03455 [Niabella sp. SCN 42-15]OJU27715.1 MAG: hypothetical protein BGN92_01470 [Sphingobacteriales bacterium 41-5]